MKEFLLLLLFDRKKDRQKESKKALCMSLLAFLKTHMVMIFVFEGFLAIAVMFTSLNLHALDSFQATQKKKMMMFTMTVFLFCFLTAQFLAFSFLNIAALTSSRMVPITLTRLPGLLADKEK